MRILWLSHFVPYPPHGGALQRSYHLLTQLARHHDVDLWAVVQPAWLQATRGTVEKGLEEAREELAGPCGRLFFRRLPNLDSGIRRVTATAAQLLHRDGYTARWLYDSHAAEDLARFAADGEYDAVHVDTLSLNEYRRLIGAGRTSLTHHNIESAMMARRSEKETSGIKRRIFATEARKIRQYEKAIAAHYDLHIVCSDLDRERFLDVAPDARIVVVPNPVDVDYFSPRHDVSNRPSLVFAGNMSWYPNRDAMFYFAEQIWPILKRQIPEIRMDLIGAHPPRELETLGRQDPDFAVHGFVDDVREYLGDATVYVCPIRDGGGTKLKVLDALAMGKAVVADPLACEGIDVTDGVDVLFANAPEEFASSVVRLVNDAGLRKRLENNARKLAVGRYAVDAVGQKLAEVYDRLCANDLPEHPALRTGSESF